MRRSLVFLFALAGTTAFAQRGEQRTYDLQNVKWSVVLDPTHRAIAGDVVNTLTPLKPIDEVRLDCVRLTIDDVQVDGKKAKYALHDDALWVTLAKRAQPGDKLAVRVKYHGTPDAGIYFIDAKRSYPAKTPVVYTQGEMEDTRYWLPTYDFPDDKATTEGTIDVPKGWNVLSNGGLEEKRDHGDRTIFHWKMDLPHSTYLISLVAGPYTETQDGKRSLPVSYWVPEGLEAQGKATFGDTDDMIQLYEKLTGFKYPFAKFAQSAVPDFMFGGMENVTAVTQTISALHPERTEPLESSEGLVAHELAHQWFGDTVTCVDWGHVWINEGFASFLPAFVARARHGEDSFALERFNAFQGGLNAHRSQKRPMIWNQYKDAFELFNDFAYPGGASRLFMLMHQLGEEPFWKGIHDFLESYKFKNVSTEQFFSSMSKSTGVDLEPFRKQWFYVPDAPSLAVSRTSEGFTLTQGATLFDLPIEYAIVDADGGPSVAGTIRLSQKSATIAASPGSLILVDPNVWLMADIRYDLPLTSEQWIAMYRHAPNAGEKMRLSDRIREASSEAQREQLLREETNPTVRATIVRTLDNADLLCTLASDPNAFVREAALQHLGDLPKTPRSVQVLTREADDESNDSLKYSAWTSLMAQTDDESLVDKAYRTTLYRDGLRTWALGWWRDHRPDKARDLALSIVENPPNEALRTAAIEALGVVKDKPGEHRAFDALCRIVQEPTIGGVRAAIGALRRYGDKRAIPFLEIQKDHSLHFVRNEAREAIHHLGG